jgi:hypothetical protein
MTNGGAFPRERGGGRGREDKKTRGREDKRTGRREDKRREEGAYKVSDCHAGGQADVENLPLTGDRKRVYDFLR